MGIFFGLKLEKNIFFVVIFPQKWLFFGGGGEREGRFFVSLNFFVPEVITMVQFRKKSAFTFYSADLPKGFYFQDKNTFDHNYHSLTPF